MEGTKTMKDKIKKVLEPILGYGIIALVVLVIISIIAIFSGTVMKIFGFEYETVSSIIIFFIISTLISLPINLLAKALPKALLEMNHLNVLPAKILFIVLDTIATAIGMMVVDYFMKNVVATNLSIIIIALILAIPSAKDIENSH